MSAFTVERLEPLHQQNRSRLLGKRLFRPKSLPKFMQSPSASREAHREGGLEGRKWDKEFEGPLVTFSSGWEGLEFGERKAM